MRKKKSKIDSINAEALSIARTEPERANELAEWTLQESKSENYLKGQADSLKVLVSLLNASDPVSANAFAEEAIELYNQIGDEVSTASLLLGVARFQQNLGWVNRAHYVLADAYEKATKGGNSKVRAAALFNLGANAEERSDYSVALEYFSCAKAVAEETANEQTYWRAVCAEQEMHYLLKDGHFQLNRVHEAMNSLSIQGQESCLIEILMFLSKVVHDSSDVVASRLYLKKAFLTAKRTGNEQAKAEILYQFGIDRLQEGRLKSAKKLLQAAMKAASRLEIHVLELSCLKQISAVHHKLGDSNAAFEAITRYVALKEDLDSHETERHFDEMRTMQQVQIVEEESKILKLKNTELAAVNSRLEAALQETQKLQRELQRLVTIDELTGALNRREVMSRGNDIVSRFHSQGRPSAVLIVDIDHFKSINDDFGHATGDEVLRRFTKSCQRVLRPTDSFGRLGGEEFCILLDRTRLDVAVKVAERVLKSIRSTRVSDLMGDRIVTASIGLVEVGSDHETIEIALHDADTALYDAKRSGRDKISVNGVRKKKAA